MTFVPTQISLRTLIWFTVLMCPFLAVMNLHLHFGAILLIGYIGIWAICICTGYGLPQLAAAITAFSVGTLWYFTSLLVLLVIGLLSTNSIDEIDLTIAGMTHLELALRFCIATLLASLPVRWMAARSVFTYPLLPGLFFSYLVFMILALLPIVDWQTGNWGSLAFSGMGAIIVAMFVILLAVSLLSFLYLPLGYLSLELINDATDLATDDIMLVAAVQRSIKDLQMKKSYPVELKAIAKESGCFENEAEKILKRLLLAEQLTLTAEHGYAFSDLIFPEESQEQQKIEQPTLDDLSF